MHELLFLTDEAIRNTLSGSLSGSLQVLVAVDSANYNSTSQLFPYVVINSKQAQEDEPYQAENYNVDVEITLTVNPSDYTADIRTACGQIVSLIKDPNAPATISGKVSGLKIKTIGAGGTTNFRREIQDAVWKFVMTTKMYAFLIP